MCSWRSFRNHNKHFLRATRNVYSVKKQHCHIENILNRRSKPSQTAKLPTWKTWLDKTDKLSIIQLKHVPSNSQSILKHFQSLCNWNRKSYQIFYIHSVEIGFSAENLVRWKWKGRFDKPCDALLVLFLFSLLAFLEVAGCQNKTIQCYGSRVPTRMYTSQKITQWMGWSSFSGIVRWKDEFCASLERARFGIPVWLIQLKYASEL